MINNGPAAGSSSSGLTGEPARTAINVGPEGDLITPVQRAFLHIAFLRDYHRTSFLGKAGVIRRFLKVKTGAQAQQYMEAVKRRMPNVRRKPSGSNTPFPQ